MRASISLSYVSQRIEMLVNTCNSYMLENKNLSSRDVMWVATD